MKILIRCDSSLKIGTGHVTRCLTLADLLKRSGHDITFVCRELSGNIINIVKERQFPVIILPPSNASSSSENPSQWLDVSKNLEITQFAAIFELEKPEWIIVDHYGLTENWEKSLASTGAKIFVIDDLLREHEANCVLDQNLHTDALTAYKQSSPGAKLMLGPTYALLSSQFLSQQPPQRIFDEVNRILIFFGGSDEAGETLKLLRLMKSHHITSKNIDVVIGLHNPFKEEIRILCEGIIGCILHVQTSRMSELMRDADIFIGASGSTTWERCYLGLPSLCMAVATNQIEVARNLQLKNVHTYLGLSNEVTDSDYIAAIRKLLNESQLREIYSKNSLALQVSSKLKELTALFKN